MSQTHPTAPVTKTARQARIAAILAREQVRSQEELADLLERYASVHVTQATLSRDLDELGVVRLRAPGGALVYALPEEPGGPGSRPGVPGASTSPTPQTLPTSPTPQTLPTSPILQTPRAAPGAPPTPAAPEPRASSGHRGSQRQREHTAESARDGRLARYLAELMTSAEASANLVVLRTPAGAAQFLASVVDHAALPTILGTVAGDDTVLVITRDPAGGDVLAADLLRRAERRRLEARKSQKPQDSQNPRTHEPREPRKEQKSQIDLNFQTPLGWPLHPTGSTDQRAGPRRLSGPARRLGARRIGLSA
jgi:transcriptional regulator of arginine metabolism